MCEEWVSVARSGLTYFALSSHLWQNQGPLTSLILALSREWVSQLKTRGSTTADKAPLFPTHVWNVAKLHPTTFTEVDNLAFTS